MKILLSYRFESNFEKLSRRIARANIKFLYRFGAMVRNAARGLTRGNPAKPRPEGQPWRRGTGWLRDSIVFDVDKMRDEVSIGFFRGVYSSELHEFGGTVRGGKSGLRIYPARPALTPAFDKTVNMVGKRFPEMYRNLFERS